MLAFAVVAGMMLSAFAEQGAAQNADPLGESPLGDMALGSPNAPVTVTEYASMSCSHCAAFNNTVYPKVKASFIDTGKIRFVFREFPLDIKAAAGSMLARCLANGEPEKYFAAIDLLFRTQNDWVSGNSPDGLKRIAIQAGLGTKGFQDCLANDEMLNAIKQTRESAIARLDVKSTPTFFVDGVRVNETGTFEALEEAITSRLTH